MTLENLLDLRKKDSSRIKIVEKIIIQPRSLWSETARVILVIAIVSTVVYGISFADINPFTSPIDETSQPEIKTFSAIGLVSDINNQSLVLNSAQATTEDTSSIFTIDISSVQKIETDQYLPISVSDIKVGDNIIVQGDTNGGALLAKRIVSFSYVVDPSKNTIESTSTKIASTTLETSSSTENVSVISSTTTDIDEVATTSTTFTETIENILSSVVDIFTGTTSTTTEATSTEVSINLVPGTTTPDLIEASSTIATSSDIVLGETSATTTGIIETIKNVVSDLIDSVTGSSSSTSTENTTADTQVNLTENIPESTLVASSTDTSSLTETSTNTSTNN